jgi:putative endonuclease
MEKRQGFMTQRAWYLYVLECEGDRLYTGISVDVEARLLAHRQGKGAKFTQSFPPRRLLFSARFEDRAAASRAEYDFKRLTATEKREFLRRNPTRETI